MTVAHYRILALVMFLAIGHGLAASSPSLADNDRPASGENNIWWLFRQLMEETHGQVPGELDALAGLDAIRNAACAIDRPYSAGWAAAPDKPSRPSLVGT